MKNPTQVNMNRSAVSSQLHSWGLHSLCMEHRTALAQVFHWICFPKEQILSLSLLPTNGCSNEISYPRPENADVLLCVLLTPNAASNKNEARNVHHTQTVSEESNTYALRIIGFINWFLHFFPSCLPAHSPEGGPHWTVFLTKNFFAEALYNFSKNLTWATTWSIFCFTHCSS